MRTNYLFEKLCCASDDELEAIMQNGHMPNPDRLVGWEYDGWSTLPITKHLNMQKFRKGFIKVDNAPEGRQIKGYNSRMQTNGLNDLWLYQLKKEGSQIFRFFDVYPASEDPKANLYSNALLFNYNVGKNKLMEEPVKDYIVEATPNNSDVLIGKLYVLLDDLVDNVFGKLKLDKLKGKINGKKHLGPNYFILRKAERISSALEQEIKEKHFGEKHE